MGGDPVDRAEDRLSQTWRDARITSIYEGTNGIHAAATAARGLRMQGGAGVDAFDALVGRLTDRPEALTLRETWRRARTIVADAEDPAALAHDFTELSCALYYRAVWSRIGTVSEDPAIAQLSERVVSHAPPWLARDC